MSALFRFKGKSGKLHEITVVNKPLSRLVKQCQDLPGQVLFQYVDPDGGQHQLRSQDINQYLREISGDSFSAKDFRT
jgi:DNA topoisomerase-1